MIPLSRPFLWLILCFCIACEPSVTQSSATVPNHDGTEQANSETTSVQPQKLEKSPPKTWDKTIFVREKRVDCEGEGPRLCMQVREANSEEWVLFYGRIEGFSYEEGHAYELRVKAKDATAPLADGPSQRLELVEVVSKEKKPMP